MESLKVGGFWPPLLAKRASQRGSRIAIGETAVWHYPAESDSSRGRILMVHGFRGDHHGLEAIAGALPDWDIWIPDLPGYGKTETFEGKHDLEHYAEWLIDLVKQVRPDILAGHSFGTQVIATRSELLAGSLKVVLINPIVLRSIDRADLANRLARACYRFASTLGAIGSSFLRSWLLVRVMSVAMCKSRSPRLRSWIHGQHHRYFSGYRLDRVAIEGFWSAASCSVEAEWSGSAPVPALIAGSKDQIVPIDAATRFAKKIGARITIIPGAGHLVHYEHPQEVAFAIESAAGD